MDQNDTDLEKGEVPLRIVKTREAKEYENQRIYGISIGCLHCEEPACIQACPSNCLFRDEDTGMVLFDSSDCIACRGCLTACPNDSVFFSPDRRMIKCDGCVERVRRSLDPACTRVCPTGALTLG